MEILSTNFMIPKGCYISIIPHNAVFPTCSLNENTRPKYCNEELNAFRIIHSKLLDYAIKALPISMQELGVYSSLSAEINQKYFPKNEYDWFYEQRKKENIDGFCVAHTGTVITCFFEDISKFNYIINIVKGAFNPSKYDLFFYCNSSK